MEFLQRTDPQKLCSQVIECGLCINIELKTCIQEWRAWTRKRKSCFINGIFTIRSTSITPVIFQLLPLQLWHYTTTWLTSEDQIQKNKHDVQNLYLTAMWCDGDVRCCALYIFVALRCAVLSWCVRAYLFLFYVRYGLLPCFIHVFGCTSCISCGLKKDP